MKLVTAKTAKKIIIFKRLSAMNAVPFDSKNDSTLKFEIDPNCESPVTSMKSINNP
jgi:hypothetical protein